MKVTEISIQSRSNLVAHPDSTTTWVPAKLMGGASFINSGHYLEFL